MIVVDTNVVAYTVIEGVHSPLARRMRDLDAVWRVPALCRHEYLNLLANYVRSGGMTLEEARRAWLEAAELLTGCFHAVDMMLALRLALEHKISAYDAQFLALSQQLGVLCITEDRRLRRACPSGTQSMQEFCAR